MFTQVSFFRIHHVKGKHHLQNASDVNVWLVFRYGFRIIAMEKTARELRLHVSYDRNYYGILPLFLFLFLSLSPLTSILFTINIYNFTFVSYLRLQTHAHTAAVSRLTQYIMIVNMQEVLISIVCFNLIVKLLEIKYFVMQ